MIKKLKLFIKSTPVLGPLLERAYEAAQKMKWNYLYTYALKPRIITACISALRSLVKVDALTISRSAIVVSTGTIRYNWDPTNGYSLLGFPLRGDFEKLETEVALKVSRHASCIVDVGGNFGWFACQLRAEMPAGGQIHIFEPVPSARQELIANLDLNPRPEVTTRINDCCLSDSTGDVTLHIPKQHGSAFASLKKQNFAGGFDILQTRSTTLDSYCASNDIHQIDLLKIDVEGAEMKVLQGSRGILSAAIKPAILIESHPRTASAFGYQVVDVVNTIKGMGYKGFVFTKNALEPLTDKTMSLGYDFLFIDQNKSLNDIL